MDLVHAEFHQDSSGEGDGRPRRPSGIAPDHADAAAFGKHPRPGRPLPSGLGLVEGFRWLPHEELIEAVTRDDASERFVGGSVDLQAKTLTLLRGDIKAVVAPFSIFPKSADGTAPDFAGLRLTDYGRTVALGDYEASSDAILYELDLDYRRRLKKHRRQSDRTFGASLMRLRKQRRLKRSDFASVSSKAIARIERNEVEKPHAKTLEAIADRLGVQPEEIESY